MRIILISGKARAGKDTCANFIKQKLEQKGNKVLITHFADLLKFICQNYFGWNGKKDDEGRQILQFIGTNVVRNKHPNYWVDFLIKFLTIFKGHWDYVIVADCRFKNELERWGGWDTINLRVNRLNFTSPLTPEQKSHISETALDDYEFDYVINSESGLDKLEKAVDKFIEWMEATKGE